jgi:hypothetical protein
MCVSLAIAGSTRSGVARRKTRRHFLDEQARIYIVWNGVTFSLEEHHELQWINERHQFGRFSLTPLSASPERVRAVDTVYWQAEFRGRPAPNVIKAVVGEDWILERNKIGQARLRHLHEHVPPHPSGFGPAQILSPAEEHARPSCARRFGLAQGRVAIEVAR